ncbi:MAG: hypothetical protein IJ880_03315 [Bacilli bacterium]|nr:hypothetical protein [Bacilli bacterium]
MTHIMEIIGMVVLIGLLMGKGIMDAIVHITAWVMTKLAERDTFKIAVYEFDMAAYYAEHLGDVDIEH